MVNIYVARHGQDVDNSNGILNGHRDEPLTALGRQQAKDVGDKMLKAGFSLATGGAAASESESDSSSTIRLSAVYSSPLKRAHDTAEIFAGILSGADDDDDADNANQSATDGTSSSSSSSSSSSRKVEIQVLDDLIERDFGIMTGQPTSSILEKCGEDRILATETINYFLDPKGAETFPDLIDRADRLLSYINKITATDDRDSNILLVTHGDFGKMLYAAYYGLRWEEVLRQFHFGNSEVLLLARDSPPGRAHVFETLQFNA